MIGFIKNNDVVNLWKEASTLLEYLVVFWLTALILISISGFVLLIIKWILDPTMWDNIQFVIYDYWE